MACPNASCFSGMAKQTTTGQGSCRGNSTFRSTRTASNKPRKPRNCSADVNVGRIVASDLSRVLETVTFVNARLGVEIDIDPRLRERHFGPYQDKPRTKDFWELPDVPGIEPMEAFVARIMAALADHKDTPLPLFVSHGGFLRACAEALPVALAPKHYANAVPMEFTRAGGRWSCRMLDAAEAALPA